MYFYSGIDIGSTSIKIAIIDQQENLIVSSSSPTGSRFDKNAMDALSSLCEKNGIDSEDIKYTTSTGYGRKLFKGSDGIINEITANAVGASFIENTNGKIKTIINIGGQDSKIILLDKNGNVANFAMNDKCAAGTGRFLELAARNLELDIEELSNLHFEAGNVPLPINSTCAVFAESEIISLLSAGHKKCEIVAGVHYSIAKRITRLAGRINIEDAILFDGGTALNRGMITALEDEFMRKIIVAEFPEITTAIGAAIIAKDSC